MASETDIPSVLADTLIESQWGNQIRDRAVGIADTVAGLPTDTDPGQVVFVLSTQRLYVQTDATTWTMVASPPPLIEVQNLSGNVALSTSPAAFATVSIPIPQIYVDNTYTILAVMNGWTTGTADNLTCGVSSQGWVPPPIVVDGGDGRSVFGAWTLSGATGAGTRNFNFTVTAESSAGLIRARSAFVMISGT